MLDFVKLKMEDDLKFHEMEDNLNYKNNKHKCVQKVAKEHVCKYIFVFLCVNMCVNICVVMCVNTSAHLCVK